MERNEEGMVILQGEAEMLTAHAAVRWVLAARDMLAADQPMPVLEAMDQDLGAATELVATVRQHEPAINEIQYTFPSGPGQLLVSVMRTVSSSHNDELVVMQLNSMLADIASSNE